MVIHCVIDNVCTVKSGETTGNLEHLSCYPYWATHELGRQTANSVSLRAAYSIAKSSLSCSGKIDFKKMRRKFKAIIELILLLLWSQWLMGLSDILVTCTNEVNLSMANFIGMFLLTGSCICGASDRKNHDPNGA